MPDSVSSEPATDTLLWLVLGQFPIAKAVAAQGTKHAVQAVAVSCNASLICKAIHFQFLYMVATITYKSESAVQGQLSVSL